MPRRRNWVLRWGVCVFCGPEEDRFFRGEAAARRDSGTLERRTQYGNSAGRSAERRVMPRKGVERAVGALMKRLGLSDLEAHRRLERLALRDQCGLDEAAAQVLAAEEFWVVFEGWSRRGRGQGHRRRGRPLE